MSEYLHKNFSQQYKNPDDIKYSEPKSTTESMTSIADELKKLKELLDSGVLTKEEFESQKTKLLNQ